MKLFLATFTVFFLSGCCSLTWAAGDEFGSRFGGSSPYALQNTLDKAQQDTQGINLDDLTEVQPAAGPEKPKETPEDDQEAEADADYYETTPVKPETLPQPVPKK